MIQFLSNCGSGPGQDDVSSAEGILRRAPGSVPGSVRMIGSSGARTALLIDRSGHLAPTIATTGRPMEASVESPGDGLRDSLHRRNRQVLQGLGGRQRDMRRGDPGDRPIEVPERLFGDYGRDLGAPSA